MDITPPVIEPGENTTEFAAMQSSSLWSKLMIIIGALAVFLPEMLSQLAMIPGLADTVIGTRVIQVLGIVSFILGGIMKTITTIRYNDGRAVIKASAVYSLPPSIAAPPPVPKTDSTPKR